MRYPWFLCFLMLSCNPVWGGELRLVADTSETWIARESPQEAETEWEILAVRAAGTKAPVVQGRLAASSLGFKGSSHLVMVEEASETPEEGLYNVKSFEVCGGKICGDTSNKFVTKPNPENEQIAREVAMAHLKGNSKVGPVFSNGKAFVVEYDGKCSLTVVEKNSTDSSSYRYNTCQ